MHMLTEPLLKKLLRYVMSDEARHVAFGVISLQELYSQLAEKRRKPRSARSSPTKPAVRLRSRFFAAQDVWERMGVDPKAVVRFLQTHPDPMEEMFQTMLFSKIVPNVKKLGLLDAGDGSLRQRFTDLGIIQFEDNTDTEQEYDSRDAVAPTPRLGSAPAQPPGELEGCSSIASVAAVVALDPYRLDGRGADVGEGGEVR